MLSVPAALLVLAGGLELQESHVLGVVSALAVALGTLWRSQHAAHLRAEARADACDERVGKLYDRIERLELVIVGRAGRRGVEPPSPEG